MARLRRLTRNQSPMNRRRLSERRHGAPQKEDTWKAGVDVRSWAILTFLASALLAGQAAEEAATPEGKKPFLPWERGAIKFGGFISTFDSTLAFGLNHAAGVSLNAEELLGLDSSLTVFRADAMYRLGKSLRHQLDFTYASYHRDGDATLSEEITINGMTYPIGAHIETVFNFDIL